MATANLPKSSGPVLAILGAKPAFSDRIHVGRPNMGDRKNFMQRVEGILDRNWLTNQGPLVAEFEKEIAELAGTEHCIAMCNGTVALEIAIRALELEGEVIVPSFTFIATAHALQWQEITPVFCDVDPSTHNIDCSKIEEMITPRTTGIIGVHLWGRAANIDALTDIANSYNLKLMFDASHALGCSYKSLPVGGFGEAEVFSFHATKFVNTFEGGAVVTNNEELAGKLRLMKNFGFVNVDDVEYIGMNGKMSEISAAMGLTSVENMKDVVRHNQHNYEVYRRNFADVPGIRLLEFDGSERSNYQYVVVEVDESLTGLQRDELVAVLYSENVVARRYFYPGCHRMEPYKSLFPHANLLLPNTESIAQRVLVLPTGMAVNEGIIERICQIIRVAIENAGLIRSVLSDRGVSGIPADMVWKSAWPDQV